MFAYDVNGDGLNDVITCLNPHGYGLVWWEQVRDGTNITFKQHIIMAQTKPAAASACIFPNRIRWPWWMWTATG